VFLIEVNNELVIIFGKLNIKFYLFWHLILVHVV